MLKQFLSICAVLAIGAALFYVGNRAMPWVMSHPDVVARRPQTGAPQLPRIPEATQTYAVMPPASRTPTRPVTSVASNPTSTSRPGTKVAPTVTLISATYTPMPTFTPAPTASPMPPKSVSTPPRTATPSVTAPVLLEPPANETLRGRVTFRWQRVALPPGAGYEVVWWRVNESPNAARGFADPVTTTELATNLDGALGGQQQTVRWAVLVVNQKPYERLTQPSESNSRELIYQP